jgi:hypothetical protein
MEHSFAINQHAAERYLLGELNETERDAYEEHFFCCAPCAEEVKSASEFMQNARRVIQGEMRAEIYGRAARRSPWKDWLNFKSILQPIPMAACLLFAMLIGYQNSIVIPRLSEMASIQLTTSTVMLHVARGTPTEVSVPKAESFALVADIPPANDVVTSYQVSVLDVSNGKTLLVKTVAPEKKSFELQFPAGLLKPGRYDVQLQAMNGSSKGELSTFSFELKFKD